MVDPSFIHLRLHSEFSIVDGMVRIDDAVASAVVDRMPALALTDLNNLFGVVKFYQAARGKGIKPDRWTQRVGGHVDGLGAVYCAVTQQTQSSLR